MPSPRTLRKVFERARRLPPERLIAALGRRGVTLARSHAAETFEWLLGVQWESGILLAAAVPGASSTSEAVRRIEAEAGSLPVPIEQQGDLLRTFERIFPAAAAALVDRAERSCLGEWELLGHAPVRLSVRPDWQLDFRSGSRWDSRLPAARQPIVRGDGSDIKVPWELSRLQHLPAVAHAFQLTGEPRFFSLVCQQIEAWIDDNPLGLGVNWVCTMEVALRAVSMSWAWELCRRSPGVPEALRAKVYASLFDHARFIERHLEDGGVVVGNHYVADLLGLCWLGSLYPALRGATDWRELATARLARHLRSQLRRDGGDGESSLPYHRLVAELVGLAASILASNGRGAHDLNEALGRMATFTEGLLQPDGAMPQLGDNDSGRAFRLLGRPPREHSYLVSWVALLTDEPHLAAAATLDAEALLLVGPDAPRRHAELAASGPTPHGPRANAFRESGLCAVRDREFYLLLAATPVGQHGAGGHGHNDKLSFELYLGGSLVADPGSFVYTSDPAARNQFRGTAAHATLQVDGREQNDLSARDLFFLPERAHATTLRFEPTPDGWLWEAEHRGYAPLVHRRTVRAWPGLHAIRVDDEVVGPRKGGEHELVARLPLAPGTVVRREVGGFLLAREGRPDVRVRVGEAAEAKLAIDAGWHSSGYGVREPCEVLRITAHARLPARMTLSLAPATSERRDL